MILVDQMTWNTRGGVEILVSDMWRQRKCHDTNIWELNIMEQDKNDSKNSNIK